MNIKQFLTTTAIVSLALSVAMETVSAAPVTVDFSVLGTGFVDITASLNPDGLTLNRVAFRYDDVADGVAGIDANGIFGTTAGGHLVFDFDVPATELYIDFKLFGATRDLPQALIAKYYYQGSSVGSELPTSASFIAVPDPILGYYVLGNLAYNGPKFDQAFISFSTEGIFFSVTNVSYKAVPPFMTIGLVDQVVQLTVTGTPDTVIGIDSSTNLVDWTTIAVITNVTGAVIYDVTNFPDVSCEFFRSFY